MHICTWASAALVLQISWYIIPVANLSSEALLPLLSPWVPYIIRLLSAGTKYLIFCDIHNYYNTKILYLLRSGNVHFMHSPPASAYFHKLLNCYLRVKCKLISSLPTSAEPHKFVEGKWNYFFKVAVFCNFYCDSDN